MSGRPRFFEELDYVNEGRNQTLFAESIKDDLPQVCSRSHLSCWVASPPVMDLILMASACKQSQGCNDTGGLFSS